MEYDIRLLTLYKQHYRDTYDAAISFNYSCWGYFDGMDVKGQCCGEPFSALWQMEEAKITEQRGDCSTQNIGLLRCFSNGAVRKTAADFWKENERMPFFGVLLLQLEGQESEYDILVSQLEQQCCCEVSGQQAPRFCRALAYNTFDNTDLVLLLHGNSLQMLQNALREVEKTSAVCYVHSIFGVAEDYLQAGNVQDTFRGTVCFLEEILSEIRINVVTNGSSEVQEILRVQLEDWGGENIDLKNAVVLSQNGHATFSISLQDIKVRDMLRLFMPGALGTHQNPIYGKCVYNISTSLLFDKQRLLDISRGTLPTRQPGTSSRRMCRQLMEECVKELAAAQGKKDESLCFYYQAMFQTLNSMSQYEQFELSENIYLSLIPAFCMLIKQFTAALESAGEGQRRENIKNSLRRFLEYANMVIYHTIHTDQSFLMIPGYSGTVFSIPVKLMLLFLWLSRCLIQLLNDSDNRYECILTPVLESRPMTHAVEFDPEDQNRLIALRVSTRLLYRPRELAVILTHEIAHYVGKGLRCRKGRLEMFSKLTAYYVVNRLLPQELWPKDQPEKFEACKRWFDQMYGSLLQFLKDHVESFREPEPYAKPCIEQLSGACQFWLAAQSDRRDSLVLRVPSELEEELLQKPDRYVLQMRFLTRIQHTVQQNWRILLYTGDCGEVIDEMFSISREIFSDMVALRVLGCSREDFEEAFSASEGMPINDRNCPATQWVRQDIACRVRFCDVERPQEYNVAEHNAREEFYQYRGTLQYLEQYARMCDEKLRLHLEQSQFQPLLTGLRAFYTVLTQKPEESQADIYREIVQHIEEYKGDVKRELSGH